MCGARPLIGPCPQWHVAALGLDHAERRGAELDADRDARHGLERRANDRDRGRQIAKHQLRVQPHHPVPSAGELPITTRVSALPTGVVTAIHFDDQPDAGREEIHM